ncbi:DUF58 domain-containing protein [Solicola gregarius]|uniref:DUF58 domain-containing protein n=1 Tax=Solicola gregarius TaxID=2908642 RepID=A0AA46TIZ0_9ACTN|nr:DUF58 domain-containing protein [Solicola gregarius]UYM05363.1 DUF58 domain-containing protein [Solicola gregarius]
MRVGILAMALPLLTAFLVSRARYRLMAHRSLSPTRISVGQDALISLSLVNEGRMPMGLLLFEDHVPYALGRPARFTVDHMSARWHQDLTYTVRSSVRGQYSVGPLSVRVSDPFGFIALRRSFTVTSELMVTPPILALRAQDLTGEWSGTGERRPRAFSVGSAEDVTVREYRRGDDLRRVHWRSSAHAGELMVRREEQPWQSRATVVLDTRRSAHAGSGSESSLEWCVTAAASISVYLARSGFAVRLVTDHPEVDVSAWADNAADPYEQTGPILDQLAVVGPSPYSDLDHASSNVSSQPGLVIALLGASSAHDLGNLARLTPTGSRAMVMLLDVGAWTTHRPEANPDLDRQQRLMRASGWSAITVGPQETPASAWDELGKVGAPTATTLAAR